MRLWTTHPKYLDKAGLVCLWRDALLAQKILQGKAKGYKLKSQLKTFEQMSDPLHAIGTYLSFVASEASKRGYKFAHEKIENPNFDEKNVNLKPGEFFVEVKDLNKKLKSRNADKLLLNGNKIEPHPMFNVNNFDVKSLYK